MSKPQSIIALAMASETEAQFRIDAEAFIAAAPKATRNHMRSNLDAAATLTKDNNQ